MNETFPLIHSDVIISSARVLILLSKFEERKSIKITIDKIMLYDFYMKFPNIMIDGNDKSLIHSGYSYFDHYSFYHWKPDREKYQILLRFLLAKNLIVRIIKERDFCYQINENGKAVILEMKTEYAEKMKAIAQYVRSSVYSISETQIESEIIARSFKFNKESKEEGRSY